MVAGALLFPYWTYRKTKNLYMKLYRALNDFDPKDRATLKELKAALAKASDEMDDHPGIAKYEAAYKAAEKTYNDFLEKAKTVKSNSKFVLRRK